MRAASKSWSGNTVPPTHSHDLGPSHSNILPACRTPIFGSSGNGAPSKRSASATNDSCAASPRTFHANPYVTSPSVTLARALLLASDTQPLPIRIDEARRTDADLHFRAGERRWRP